MNQENVSITVPMTPAGGVLLRALADKLPTLASAPVSNGAAPAAEAPKKGPGRPAKAKDAPAPVQGATAGGVDDLDLGGADAPGDELGLDDPAPAAPAKPLTLEADVVPAFKAFIDHHKGDKTEAAKIMTSFGAKGVRELKPEQYAAVIAKLKIK